jgi:hypothetical protein
MNLGGLSQDHRAVGLVQREPRGGVGVTMRNLGYLGLFGLLGLLGIPLDNLALFGFFGFFGFFAFFGRKD